MSTAGSNAIGLHKAPVAPEKPVQVTYAARHADGKDPQESCVQEVVDPYGWRSRRVSDKRSRPAAHRKDVAPSR